MDLGEADLEEVDLEGEGWEEAVIGYSNQNKVTGL